MKVELGPITMLNHIAYLLSEYGYPGIVILLFLNTSIGFPPSEVVCFLVGTVSASGRFDLVTCIFLGTAANTAGTSLLYFGGMQISKERYERWSDPGLVRHVGRIRALVGFGASTLRTVRNLYIRYGWAIILVGRNVPLLRSVISIPAGIYRMRLHRFLLLSTIGIGIWISVWMSLGFLLRGTQDPIAQWLGFGAALVLASVVGLLVTSRGRSSQPQTRIVD